MRSLKRSEWVILTLLLVFSFVPTFGGLVRVVDLMGGPAIAPHNPRASALPVPIILHILSSFLFCLVGAFQFWPSMRRAHPRAHRRAGRMLVGAGCVSAATGVWMTHVYTFPTELQGSVLYWVRMGLGSAMIGLIGGSVIAIRARRVFQHSAMMMRAYAIGQGASTQTFFGIGWIIWFGAEASGPARDVLMVSAWAGNLIAAEVLIWTVLKSARTPDRNTAAI
jgi:hypothetical protein